MDQSYLIPMDDKKQIFCSLSSVPKGTVYKLNGVIYSRFINGKLRWLSFFLLRNHGRCSSVVQHTSSIHKAQELPHLCKKEQQLLMFMFMYQKVMNLAPICLN